MIGAKRDSGDSCGVRPPWPNQACPSTMVMPAMKKLIATPETIWLPRLVIEAKPCTRLSATEQRMPAPSPSQAESVR